LRKSSRERGGGPEEKIKGTRKESSVMEVEDELQNRKRKWGGQGGGLFSRVKSPPQGPSVREPSAKLLRFKKGKGSLKRPLGRDGKGWNSLRVAWMCQKVLRGSELRRK